MLGHFCTGVTVVTGMSAAGPVGFACQSFAALSLDPPLVLFCPQRTSGSWAAMSSSGAFCVNVLAEDQRELSAVFGRAGADKFAGVSWSPSGTGAAVLDGALTWVDCRVTAVHEAGDHFVVIGAVDALGPVREARPLLFYRGRYAAQADLDPRGRSGEVLDTLLTWQRQSEWS
ncbi:3-hydroxy-9,10-secoandrosta-1,3,5(10)-triene-9,17-dione monooxygenase reductase subunit [Nocardia sp. NRRL S-836]|uniref:3-hydroxy-9,10-secoandrosta-1,3,5(10)-triene-9, 17-dione monooxygenase reductase subunit n=1 Tax=Nocardia sp. NRRL S-836 TaxID=1519492 RepID=UPI0009E71874|nr:3-hydroxy-9,10-secoandrosta-1,3,5(10)-triene-9,17-dione monooxygenase reductase subunit [Nocardia sp. NRRL S-836]